MNSSTESVRKWFFSMSKYSGVSSNLQTESHRARSYIELFKAAAAKNGGSVAVEFAIVIPVFLLLVLAILSYGIYFGAAHGVAQLAADAARVSVAGLNDTERITLAKQHVAANAETFAFIDLAKVVATASPSPDDADQFTVAVSFDSSALPIWALSGIVPLPSKVIERLSSIRRGGQ